jgi:hypothetical protein
LQGLKKGDVKDREWSKSRCELLWDIFQTSLFWQLTVCLLVASVDSSLQGVGECGHHTKPWLFDHYHFIGPHKIQMQHAIVPQANGTITRIGIFGSLSLKMVVGLFRIVSIRLGIHGRVFAFSSSDMGFRNNSTMFWKLRGQIHHNKRAKGTLFLLAKSAYKTNKVA